MERGYSRYTHKRRRTPSPPRRNVPLASRDGGHRLHSRSSYRTDRGHKHHSYKRRRTSRSRSPPRRKEVSKYKLGSVYTYNYVQPVAEGAFGSVFLATDASSQRYAIKKLKLTPKMKEAKIYEREIDILLECNHNNVVFMKEVVTNTKEELFLVFNYVDYDLKQLLVNCAEQVMQVEVLKHLLLQLLGGLEYLHSKQLIHRDLKPRNLLVDTKGKLEIADLGSARKWSSGALSPEVVTLRYRYAEKVLLVTCLRAPEILLGSENYALSSDCWSVGCIFAEMLTGKPLFSGITELELLDNLCNMLGTPNDTSLPGFSQLPRVKQLKTLPSQPENRLRSHVPDGLSDSGFDLLSRFLTYDPAQRISATKARDHIFFKESPRPVLSFNPAVSPVPPAKA